METTVIFIVILALAGCKIHYDKYGFNITNVSVLVDKTEGTPEVLPDPKDILDIYRFGQDQRQQAIFRLGLVTDVQTNKVHEIFLQDGIRSKKQNQDQYEYRTIEIGKFRKDVTDAIQNCNNALIDCKPVDHSEIISSIARELELFSGTNKSVLIVYSDLRENSDLLNVYSEVGKELALKHPEKVAAIYKASYHIKKLWGVKVFLIYQPKDHEDEKLYRQCVKAIKLWLEPKEIQVIQQPDNIFHQ